MLVMVLFFIAFRWIHLSTLLFLFFLMILISPMSTLFPYTTLFRSDTVRVHVRIKESETKERLQAFEGVVIARKHGGADRKSTRLNSSHLGISYAVFCLKKKIHL